MTPLQCCRMRVLHAVTMLVMLATAQMATAANTKDPVESTPLKRKADQVRIMPDERGILLVQHDPGEIRLVDPASQERLMTLRQTIIDFAVSSNGDYVYVIGAKISDRATVLTQVSVLDGSTRTVEISPELAYPSLALTGDDRMYVSALAPSGWRLVELGRSSRIFQNEGRRIRIGSLEEHSWPVQPTADLVAFPHGLLLVHSATRSFSAFNSVGGIKLDTLVLGEPLKIGVDYPVKVVFTGAEGSGRDSGSIIASDPTARRIVFVRFDPLFEGFEVLQTVSVNLDPGGPNVFPNGVVEQPFVIASDSEQQSVVVGSRSDRRLIVLRRVGRAVELAREIPLPTAPRDLDVSTSGRVLVALIEGGWTLIRYPLERGIDRIRGAVAEGTEGIVMQLQIALSSLGYRVGAVDGIEGRETRAAISLFEAQEGLQGLGKSKTALLEQVQSRVNDQIAELTRDLTSGDAFSRRRAVELLIERHAGNEELVDALLTLLEPPALEQLSADGRVNVLSVLTGTDPGIWTAEHVERGQAAIERVEIRHREGVAEIGPKTRALLDDFVAFLKTTAS